MGDLEFEWDEAKARSNLRKHGVTFAEGATAFRDRNGRILRGRNIDDEQRQVLIGLSEVGRLIVVVFVDRRRIRIISSRRATPSERHDYEEARR
jgi:hypothetical protein